MRPRVAWFCAWLAYRIYLAMPLANDLHSLYGRFELWLLGYAGTYAHLDDFNAFVEWRRSSRP